MRNDMRNDPTIIPAQQYPALKRSQEFGYRARPVFWHTPGIPNLYQSAPTTGMVDLAPYGANLNGVLLYLARYAHVNREHDLTVYLSGGHDAGSTEPADYYRDPLMDGWRVISWRTQPMAVTYETLNTETNRKLRVNVRVAAAWFDETDADIIALGDGHNDVERLLQAGFPDGAYLLGTPAQTGLDLLEHNLPFGLELTTLPDHLREWIQHNSPQGRNEVLTAADGPNWRHEGFDEFICYDAKFMYAKFLNHVPAGPYGRYTGLDCDRMWSATDGRAVGFYRAHVHVPDAWEHIGLLPMYDADEKRTVYPWRPGMYFDTFATGAELALAQRYGWDFAIDECVVWPHANKINALRWWREYLLASRMAAEQEGNHLAATAIRHVTIDAIGAMARRNTPEHHITPREQKHTIPEDAYNFDLKPWGIEWDLDKPVSGWAAKFLHPEISAMIWGKGRAYLAGFALRYPVWQSVLFRTDAVWMNVQQRDIPTNIPAAQLKPGDWRIKEMLRAAYIPAPRDTSEALTLMRRARGKVAR